LVSTEETNTSEGENKHEKVKKANSKPLGYLQKGLWIALAWGRGERKCQWKS